MTPRQLRGLIELHRERHDPAGKAAQPATATQGGAGWLLAMSQSLERNRPVGRVNVPPAPGVG